MSTSLSPLGSVMWQNQKRVNNISLWVYFQGTMPFAKKVHEKWNILPMLEASCRWLQRWLYCMSSMLGV